MNKIKHLLGKNWIKYTIFWSWNLVFALTLVTVQVQEPFLFGILIDTWHGMIPISFALSSFIILLLPVLSIVIGLALLKNNPVKLIHYFYGVQVPIIFLCILRISLFRELNLATGIIIYSLIGSIIYYFVALISPNEKTSTVKTFAYTLLALAGVYTSLLLMFIAIPTIGYLFQGLVEVMRELIENPLQVIQMSFFGLLLFVFIVLTSTLFTIAPFALVYYYLKSFFTNYSVYKASNRLASFIVTGFVLIFLAAIVVSSAKQPQQLAFTLADKDVYSITDKQLILSKKEQVRSGLINAYLAPYRYVDTWDGMDGIAQYYKGAFNLEVKPIGIQHVFNAFMYPFLYQNVKEAGYDMEKADELYERIFDKPIQKAESASIKNALSATYDRDMAKAGILNVDETKILTTHQDITINETNFSAEVTLHERYLNQTFEQLELFYYFRLPDNAAITGLWLSNNDSVSKKFAYKVSPRGAAQKIYNQEVERRVDPSLLEQVGPHQYRLRAYPIMPKTKEYKVRNNYSVVAGEPFHIWLTYVVLKNTDNSIPMLKLLEKRNVYWNKETTRNNNTNFNWNDDYWLPNVSGAKPFVALPTNTAVNIDSTITLTVSSANKPVAKPLKLALLVDGSYSMANYTTQLLSNINNIKKTAPNVSYDIFASTDTNKMSQINESELPAITYFGVQHPAQLLSNFMSNHAIEQYDALVVLTDEGSYELDRLRLSTIKSNKPIILCHINGTEAPVYSDNLFESIIASNGTAVTQLEEAVDYLYQTSNKAEIIENNMLWKADFNTKSNGDFSMLKSIAAQKYIQLLMQQASGSALHENKNLDLIHKIAVQNSIVTPYSSMIVLVDEEQWKRLKEAEQSEDRFNRTNESGKEQLTKPFGFGVMQATATPEPHEWVLLLLVGTVLIYTIYQKRIS